MHNERAISHQASINIIFRICLPDTYIKTIKRKVKNNKALPRGIKIPSKNTHLIKTQIFQSQFIKTWIAQKFSFRMLEIKDTIPAHRHSSKEHIIKHIHAIIIKRRACKSIPKSKIKDRQHKQSILIKHIKNAVAVPAVGLTAMHKHQVFQEFELPDGVVGGTCGLLTFQT